MSRARTQSTGRPVRRMPARVALLALVGLLATSSPVAAASPDPAASGSARPSPSAEPSPQPVQLTMNTGAIVGLVVAGTRAGHASLAEGWGLVVDPSGLILANASVVAPNAPGVAAGYGDPTLPASVSVIEVWVASSAGQPMVRAYTGKVLAVDGFLDLAIVGLDSTLGDTPAPVAPGSVTMPAVALAARLPDPPSPLVAVAIADGPGTGPVTVGGFATTLEQVARPSPGSCCPVAVSTFRMPDAWPGGVFLLDGSGALAAFPAYLLGYPPGVALGTPVDAIAPLVDAARQGRAYTSPFGVPGTGNESMHFRSWSTSSDPCSGGAGNVGSYPPGTTRIAAAFDASNFTPNEDVLRVWSEVDSQALLASSSGKWGAQPSPCQAYTLSATTGTIANGRYHLELYAGGTLRQVGAATVRVGVAPGSIALSGRALDVDTGDPIADALVVVLKPGTDLQAWFTSPTDSDVAASALTRADGTFITDPPIATGTYPFLILADGYQPIGGTIRTGTNGILGDVALAPLN